MDAEKVVLTPEARAFITALHNRFNRTRLALLKKREERQHQINQGASLDFLPETATIRNDPSWRVAAIPSDMKDRSVEITGPTDRKMVINALNSGANVFMADFEDANAPTWANIIEGQKNLMDVIDGTISYETADGKKYTLDPKIAALFVRPRGWHLPEKHFLVGTEEVSGSLFDFGLFFFHNSKKIIEQGKTPSFYLPKMESHLEARLWNAVFSFAEETLSIPHGTIRATVLIETLPAAFEMEEILFELKDYIAGLNAGRWDYMFSIIKTFQNNSTLIFPCRDVLTMTVPFMRAYAKLLVYTCHKRGAQAMGGMAAFIPNKNDPKATETALKKVEEDKLREVHDGFDGTWVAHPGLISIAAEIFKKHPKGTPEKIQVSAKDLLDFHIPGGTITETCLRHNISISIQYLYSWLTGRGAAALYNLMEDVATAEIARSQLWQWLNRNASLDTGKKIDRSFLEIAFDEEAKKIATMSNINPEILKSATSIIKELVFDSRFPPFLTIPAYKILS